MKRSDVTTRRRGCGRDRRGRLSCCSRARRACRCRLRRVAPSPTAADGRAASRAPTASTLPQPTRRRPPRSSASSNAMSETFRNTTFLIAIRDSGFVCNELLARLRRRQRLHDVDGHLQRDARLYGQRREHRRAARRADAAALSTVGPAVSTARARRRPRGAAAAALAAAAAAAAALRRSERVEHGRDRVRCPAPAP